MAFNYYQSGHPEWGTSQYRFGPPRAPSFQPQPGWGGMDFYRNHAGQIADPSLFQHAWSRVQDYPQGANGGLGVGLHEARHWHRKAYAYGEYTTMSPAELGHAAAYEAYRTWIHNSSMYEPLSGDYERQREGLIAIAVAEATNLNSMRPMDDYSRMLLSEASAATASSLFWESKEENDDLVRGRSRSRPRSIHGSVSGSAYGGSSYGGTGSSYDDYDPYAVDNLRHGRRGRSRSRHRAYGAGGVIPSVAGGNPMAIPGQVSAYGQPGAYGTSAYGTPGSYGSPYGSTPVIGGSQYIAGTTAFPQTGVPMVVPSTSSRSGRSRSRHRSNSMNMPYGTQYGTPGVMAYGGSPAGQVVVMPSSSKRHKHHKSHSKHRSHSHTRLY